jgi:hypothetical protein
MASQENVSAKREPPWPSSRFDSVSSECSAATDDECGDGGVEYDGAAKRAEGGTVDLDRGDLVDRFEW